MANTTHIMLDLETWGTEPGCDIRSIGACVFDPVTGFVHDGSLGTIRPFYTAADNPTTGAVMSGSWGGDDLTAVTRKYPLTRDPRTVEWWNDPERAEASKAFVNPVDLREALRQFIVWYDTVTAGVSDFDKPWKRETVRLWSHGPAFDPPILAAAYRAVGLPVPWHYRAPRDTRTAFDMAGVEDPSAFLHQFDTGTFHHALDDAICQARAVCAAYKTVIG